MAAASSWELFLYTPGREKTDVQAVISLTLLGVSAFLIIFECRARYLYMFLPLFLILFICGTDRMIEKTVRHSVCVCFPDLTDQL